MSQGEGSYEVVQAVQSCLAAFGAVPVVKGETNLDKCE